MKKALLPLDTIKSNFNDISSDILKILTAKLKSVQKFAVQIDESTDNRAQLISIHVSLMRDTTKKTTFATNFQRELLVRKFCK